MAARRNQPCHCQPGRASPLSWEGKLRNIVVSSKLTQPGDLPADQHLTLDYSRLVSVLCLAVAEISKQVAELKQQLQSKRKNDS